MAMSNYPSLSLKTPCTSFGYCLRLFLLYCEYNSDAVNTPQRVGILVDVSLLQHHKLLKAKTLFFVLLFPVPSSQWPNNYYLMNIGRFAPLLLEVTNLVN